MLASASPSLSQLLLHVASEAQLSSAAAALVLPTTVVAAAAAVAVASCVVRISGKHQTLH